MIPLGCVNRWRMIFSCFSLKSSRSNPNCCSLRLSNRRLIDSISTPQFVFERLDMDVSRAFQDRFANDLVYEFHHGRFGIVGIELNRSLSVLQRLEGTIRLKDLVESLRADAIKRFHGAQKLRTRHEHPFSRLFQKLRCELAANGI